MKKNIALVTGGFSSEAVISYRSAVTIENNIDQEKFNVYKIDINLQGWFYQIAGGEKIEINKNDFSLQMESEKIKFDAVFIGMHGTPGEDGKLQGYFDTLKIPYSSCDATTSAITFNKRFTVAVAALSGIHVAKSVHIYQQTKFEALQISQQLTFPVFVKPSNGGSSIGMSKVYESTELESAILKAFEEDNQVLIEEMVVGREFTVGVFQTNGNIVVLPITEVKTDKDFFDFEAKYEGASTEITPAEIEETVAAKIREEAKKIYTIFNCRGVVRIDFIYSEMEQVPYMLEINTIPGQSDASIVPMQVKAMGWSLKEFYSKLIDECF
ncbi:MAG: D-alanine--D-alanine ligase [Chitinophagaceae bacterium]|nr:MAG: D-alanine--D-alanine ligase [Chitinophagaceae bacterium]